MAELLFGWWQYEFMRNAFLALLLIMPLFAMLGTLIVNNGMAFFSDALGHSSLTGVGLGVILGFSRYKPAMIVFAVIFALLMNRIRHSRLYSTDTVIGVFSACGVALGLLLLSYSGNFSRYQSLLIGDILSITKSEIIILAVTLVGIMILWLIFFNRFHLISVSPAIASSRGIKVNMLDNLFVVAVAVVVMLAIQWIGLLLINAMLILPAAAARHIARNTRSYLILTMIFGLFSGLLGLWFSYHNAYAATGPVIVLIAGILYFATFFLRDNK